MSAPVQSKARTNAAVAGGIIGAFMAILNIQVVNTSLPDIQGGIGAGLDDGGWISTAYLVGEIIVIPLSGWLAEVFSLRRYLIANAIIFLIFSAACGLATNFPEMVTLRAIQGFAGGVLIPLNLLTIITMTSEKSRPFWFSAYALTATVAPAIGPSIGGAITDLFGWRYIFFLNLVPGAFMVPALIWGMPSAPMQLRRFLDGDWIGVFSMAIGLSTLQVVLEEGNKDDWFNSPFITRLAIISVIALAMFLVQELRAENKRPVVNLRLFMRWNFALICIAAFTLGFVLYGAVYLIPVYLAVAHGYSAQETGMVMIWIGLPQFLIIPFVPWMMRRFDPRRVLGMGFLLFGLSLFMNMSLGPDDSGPQMLIPNLVRAAGQALVFPPLTMIATFGIPPRDSGSASGLFNMLRNLGGAVGIAAVQTFVTNREKFHSAMINPAISALAPATMARLARLQAYFMAHGMNDAGAARIQAMQLLGRLVRQQSYYFAYGDAFTLLGLVMAAGCLSTLFLRRLATKAPPA